MAKLSDFEFDQYCIRNNISEIAKAEIQRIRSSDPSRSVRSTFRNVSGRYPSRKMGVIIQFESHRLELVFIYLMEHDVYFIEFYDQPQSIKIAHLSQNNRNLGYLYTPDFFVISQDKAEWVECKTEEELVKLAAKNPNRYIKDENGVWRSPPAEAYAAQFGLGFRIFSSAEINETYIRNIKYLEDYYNSTNTVVPKEALDAIITIVKKEPGITLDKLKELAKSFTIDDINQAIANDDIYVDINEVPLVDSIRVRIFPNKELAEAYFKINSHKSEVLKGPTIPELKIGSLVLFDGKPFQVKNIGEQKTYLTTMDPKEQIIVFSNEAVIDMIIKGDITVIDDEASQSKEHDECLEIINKADSEDLEKANRRYGILTKYWQGEDCSQYKECSKTIGRWDQKYKKAEHLYGNGYIGLLPNIKKQGNRRPRIAEDIMKLMNEVIEKHFENLRRIKAKAAYRIFIAEAAKNNIPKERSPSYRTFLSKIELRNKLQQILKRDGKRPAYKYEPPLLLERTTPKHGDRPWEIGHIDHTELDLEIITPDGINLGRPWMTLLIDAFSRRILSVYITFDPPSYRSCMMVIRLCVNKYNRLPDNIIVDGGKEFHSVYFETLMAILKVTLKRRPPGKSHFGSVCERFFGTNNTQFIYTLIGNTQATKNVREVDKNNNPKNLAVWQMHKFIPALEKYLFEIYETSSHPTLGRSPREEFGVGITQTGNRISKLIKYDEYFKRLTLPSTPKGEATIIQSRGIKINHIYYWSNEFSRAILVGKSIPVRYDPFNVGVAYAYIDKQWVECQSEYYGILNGMTEKELKLRTAILRKQMKRTGEDEIITAHALGNMYLDNNETEEILLQQLKDKEHKALYIYGKTNNEAVTTLSVPLQEENNNDNDDSYDEADLPNFTPYGEYKN